MSEAARQETEALVSSFRSPPGAYRPMPLWVWNGEVTESRIIEMLEQFAENGMGGVFIHPRPGLVTEYLSERWFELWAFALKECGKRGLECHVYDENSFPSGFAGGHTLEADPAGIIRGLVPEGDGAGWDHGKINGWTGFRPLAALTRKETVQAFLQTTHEQYIRRFGFAAGGPWKYCFTDEPTIRCGQALYATPDFLSAFAAEHGYEFMDRMDDYMDRDPDRAWPVRFDYWRTANRLFTDHFGRAIHDWCEQHGLQFTGHYDEHLWPSPMSVPDAMAAQRWMQMPGVDLLGFQFNPDDMSRNRLYEMNIREVTSVGRQLGRTRLLCECYGGGGYRYAPDDAKAMSVMLLAHGINFLNPHISMQTVAGSRKYDWPQTLSDHNPWCRFYRSLADHDARASYLMASSKPCARVLVLHPTVSGWLHAIPKSFLEARGLQQEEVVIEQLRESHGRFLQELAARHADFDLGDECIMAELGRVADGRLFVGAACYEALVIPPGTETLLASTCDLVEQFMASGGTVLATGEPPSTVHGRRSERSRQWITRPGWRRVMDVEELSHALEQAGIEALYAPPGMIVHERRLNDGRTMYVLANPGPEELHGRLPIDPDKQWEWWDPNDGSIGGTGPRRLDSQASGEFSMSPRSLLFAIESDQKPVATRVTLAPWQELPLPTVTRIQRLSDNVMPISACLLSVADRQYRTMETARANDLMWKAHGFPQDPWEWTIQFRREYADRSFGPGTGYEVEYDFFLDPTDFETIRPTIKLAVERPWLYEIRINGQPFSFSSSICWFDENMRLNPAGLLLRPGRNIVALTVRPMNIHAEIAPVYLVGDFAVRNGHDGLVVGRPSSLTLGHWKFQGLPFYPWAVRYTWAWRQEQPAAGLHIELGAWNGSAVRWELDGQDAGQMLARPWTLTVDRPLATGEHVLHADVYGNLVNFLGPFFRKGLPIPWTWTQGPEGSYTLEHYEGLEDYGLCQNPVVRFRPA